MDELTVLYYGGIATLAILLLIFEIRGFRSGGYSNNHTYVYYTVGNIPVRIRHTVGSSYKVYVTDNIPCPAETKADRFGRYFKIKARGAQDAEFQIDELYRAG